MRQVFKLQLVNIFVLVVCTIQFAISDVRADEIKRPNILIAISDDQSFPYAGAYGDKAVKTPAFDRVAREGVLFNNAFAASPGCSPSRAALLTGRHTWELEQAGTHASSFPSKFTVYPDLLEQAGYTIGYTGKGWGPGNFKTSGRTRNPAGVEVSGERLSAPDGINSNNYAGNFKKFLKSRKTDAPFYFWYGGKEPHRSYKEGSGVAAGKRLADAFVPSFLPDRPEIRSDILDYCVEIEWFDKHLLQMMTALEEMGELENTLIVVTGDNGMPFPRAKANCYEYGIHVPLAIRWPKVIPAQRVVDDLVGFIDIGPTVLEAAQVAVPQEMTGRSLMELLRSEKSGVVDQSRTFVMSARERHSSSRYKNWTYPQRALRTKQYLYIRNFRPERWPAGHPAGFKQDAFGYYDIDGALSKTFLYEQRNSPTIGRFFHLAVDKRPAEELFDIKADPGNLKNLAARPKYAKIKQQLSALMDQELTRTGDPRILDGGDVYDTYIRYSKIREFPAPE